VQVLQSFCPECLSNSWKQWEVMTFASSQEAQLIMLTQAATSLWKQAPYISFHFSLALYKQASEPKA
jgi:hypothetical protein